PGGQLHPVGRLRRPPPKVPERDHPAAEPKHGRSPCASSRADSLATPRAAAAMTAGKGPSRRASIAEVRVSDGQAHKDPPMDRRTTGPPRPGCRIAPHQQPTTKDSKLI